MKKSAKKAMKRRLDTVFDFLIPLLLLGGIAGIGTSLLGEDFSRVAIWWLVLLVLGVVAYPVTGLIFGRFHDGGFVFSKAIGLAGAGILMWFLSSVKLLKFTRMNSLVSVGILLMLHIILLVIVAHKQRNAPKSWLAQACGYRITEKKLVAALKSEVVFFALFTLWCYLRGFKPEAYGTEKFMDYGFMAVMDRSDYMPPQDLWFSGESINYYYVGQYLATFMTKLSGVGVEYGYNLMMMMLAAFGFSMPYSIINNVVRSFLKDRKLSVRTGKSMESENGQKVFLLIRALPPIVGTVAGLATSFSGNMHYFLFRFLIPRLQRIAGFAEDEIEKFWFPNSTRYIGYNPETSDKTIHEFPSYSFVLGDLHAHAINIMFVLTVLAMLFAWLQYRKERMDTVRIGTTTKKASLWCEALHPVILLLGFFIGMFHMTNFWDFPIYFVVAGAIILFSNAVIYQFSFDTVKLTALQAVVVLAVAKIVALPFTLNFDQISTTIRLNYYRTPMHQLIVLWGLPVVLVIIFICDRYSVLTRLGVLTGFRYDEKGQKIPPRLRDEDKERLTEHEKATLVEFIPEKNKLFQFIENLTISDLFVITIGLCAIGLILIPELIYVKDIYEGDYKRSNTMFKLTFQAYIMLALCMAFILMKLTAFARTYFQRVAGIVFGLCFLTTLGYFGNAVNGWFGDVRDASRYQGLDATAFMQKESAQDAEAVAWMKENLTGTPVVLEAWGPSYSFYERISAMTGLPTVMGWQTHEWLWRSEASGVFPAVVNERRRDVVEIYYSTDEARVRELIEKYNIEYIYVGASERKTLDDSTIRGVYNSIQEERFLADDVNETLLRSLGEIVFESSAPGTASYLIKVGPAM